MVQKRKIMRDLVKIVSLFWLVFTKGDLWIYFGTSLVLGLPFIEYFSVVFDLPFRTGSFNYTQVFLLGFMWFFILLIAELINYKMNRKFYYSIGNVYFGILGFGLALFLMR
jgi:hypothetical protein